MNFENRNNKIENLEEKNIKIEQIRRKVENVIDKLGEDIDGGIKDTIIFLKTLEINTTQSCEGHFDSGTGGPYIDIEAKDISELEERLEKEKSKKEKEKISEKIESENLKERKKIIGYLNEFYEGRNTPYSNRIIINPMGRGWSRLENQGVGLQKIEPNEIKKENLVEYQKEMADFTKFLKEKYFQKN